MTPHEFITKWQRAQLSERSACQQHFLDLCDLLGQPKPAAADPDGAWYTFERGVRKTTGENGWADVWMKGRFGWEYKGKHKNLAAAYQQLQLYREALENPPLLVVCDLDRFEVHTNFTGTPTVVHAFDLAGLAEPGNLDVLRKLFTEPEALRPGLTTESITNQAAEQFSRLADGMRQRGIDAPAAAHFLMKLMFSMFAEDIGLLPEKIFGRVLTSCKNDPGRLAQRLAALFGAMSSGGDFGADPIQWFNGGLFADADVIGLRPAEIETLILVNDYDWANVEPSIFGTLFERTLDPAKRSQIGAHYTSRADILTLLEPVVMAPLRREWLEVRARCDKLWEKVKGKEARPMSRRAGKGAAAGKPRLAFERPLLDFVERLAHVRILDPACGSGNFLYVAVNLLLDLEKEVIAYAANHGLGMLPQVRPTQLSGIEINPYAQQLAQVVIWIGYLQWMHHNGFQPPRDPVLEPIQSIRLQDAILDLSDPENPKEPEWPEADFIVGNPPFLGNKQMRSELGIGYAAPLWKLYEDRLPAMSDLCCYWFEKGRQMIEDRKARRVALLATTAIKQTGARRVLERINESCQIFWAISDRDWVLDGAAVRIAMIGIARKEEAGVRILDGKTVSQINGDLSSGTDLTTKQLLPENSHLCFMGTTKVGPYDISFSQANSLLQGVNPNGRPTSDVVRPFRNGSDLVRVSSDRWIIDYGVATPMRDAALYEQPFEYIVQNVKPLREKNNDKWRSEHWWLLGRTLRDFRTAMGCSARYIGTPRVAKHRIFVWLDSVVLPDSKVIAVAFSDDVHFGILHSRMHEVWTIGTCGWHGKGNDPTYNPTLCFETFPFPAPTDAQRAAIAEAARELDRLRSAWLNPPEWTREEVLEFPGSLDGPWARYIATSPLPPGEGGSKQQAAGNLGSDVNCPHPDPLPKGEGARDPSPLPKGEGAKVGTVRYPRVVPRDEACAKELKKRTLTNLYNQRPTWLDLAHRRLDEAVFDAYGWDPAISDEEILARLLELNLGRAGS
jgi:SAM-dependent methyltransferase